MPYVVVRSDFTMRRPTYVGDADSDPELMAYLGAQKIDYGDYSCNLPSRKVLDLLDAKGYKVVSMAAHAGDKYSRNVFWTLYKQ